MPEKSTELSGEQHGDLGVCFVSMLSPCASQITKLCIFVVEKNMLAKSLLRGQETPFSQCSIKIK